MGTPASEPQDAADVANGPGNDVNGNGAERPRRRRPGTAPASRQAALNDEEFELKAEAMRAVLGGVLLPLGHTCCTALPRLDTNIVRVR